MTPDEMVDFIDNELLPQAKLEIQSWIWPRKRTGGYFVVARQILCMVDFLGAVYSGYPLSERKKDKKGKKIATPNKAKNFITTFFKPKQTYKEDTVNKLYDMYRHGLVHLYQPRILKLNSKSRLQWALYRGNRHQDKLTFGSNKGKVTFYNVNHLQIIPKDPHERNYYLVICIDSLYEDFENAVKEYRDKLKSTKFLQRNWRTTVNAICKPR